MTAHSKPPRHRLSRGEWLILAAAFSAWVWTFAPSVGRILRELLR